MRLFHARVGQSRSYAPQTVRDSPHPYEALQILTFIQYWFVKCLHSKVAREGVVWIMFLAVSRNWLHFKIFHLSAEVDVDFQIAEFL
jgi:hypothetical protein